MKKWEYASLTLAGREDWKTDLNEAGEEGWEVCGVVPGHQSGDYRESAVVLLKRPLETPAHPDSYKSRR